MNSIELKLLGQKIVLKTNSDPKVVSEVVELVRDQIREAEKSTRSPVPHHVALLALLNLAEHHIQTKNQLTDHQKQLDLKSKELIDLIESEFQ